MNKEQGKAVISFGYSSYILPYENALEVLKNISSAEKIHNEYDLNVASIEEVPYSDVKVTYMSAVDYKSIKLKGLICEKENNSSES